MTTIYMEHPLHGGMNVHTENEAAENEKHGWKRAIQAGADPDLEKRKAKEAQDKRDQEMQAEKVANAKKPDKV